MAGNEREGWVEDVLNYWYREVGPAKWFAGDKALDGEIRSRFGDLHQRLLTKLPDGVGTDPRTTLAAIIVLDQFSRNIHRGTPEAFGGDDLAVSLARQSVDRGLDESLSNEEKTFLYMPFMHSEVLADQHRCVDLFNAIGAKETLPHAIEHRDIVARYGRFPHRNRVLGRESTQAELAFLASHAGFGQ